MHIFLYIYNFPKYILIEKLINNKKKGKMLVMIINRNKMKCKMIKKIECIKIRK